MKVVNKEKRKKKGALGLISHAKVKMVSKQKKKPRLPLLTAYKSLKQKNLEMAKTINNKLDEIKELKEKNIHLMSKNMSLTLVNKKQSDALLRLERQSKHALSIVPGFVDSIGGLISTCQLVNSSTAISQRFDEMNESQKRQSQGTPMKSPSCVVLPTVSGHTITKPTINLSRLNIQRVVNSPNLSRIEEGSPSLQTSRNSIVNRTHSTSNGRMSTQNEESMRIENVSERLETANTSTDEEESTRVTERVPSFVPTRRQTLKNRRSSMFERLSMNRNSIPPSPRVQLKDVSKVLRNSQSINVRVLDQRLSNGTRAEIPEETSHNTSSSNSSIVSNQSFDSAAENSQNVNESNSDSADENQSEKIKAESSRLSNDCSGSTSKNESSHEDIDPLEGTSYQYKNSEPETDLSKRESGVFESLYDTKKLPVIESDEDEEAEEDKEEDDEEATRQVVNYVNIGRRGSNTDMDDFTLFIKKKKPPERTRFNINDYTLPNLDTPLLERPQDLHEIDDITSTMINITEKIKHFQKNESFEDPDLMTVKLPREPSMFAVESTPFTTRKRKTFTPVKASPVVADEEEDDDGEEEEEEEEEEDVIPAKIPKKQSKAKKLEKDPSAAKVVLKKLKSSQSKDMADSSVDDSLTMERSSKSHRGRPKKKLTVVTDSESEEEFDHKKSKRKTNTKSLLSEPSRRETSDSECSIESTSRSSRPKRKAAPTSLAEPKINRKMRRPK